MKRERKPFVDDGRTVAPMDLPGMPGYERRQQRKKKAETGLQLTKKERQAMRKAAVIVGIQAALLGGAFFTLIFLIVWLWIR